MRTRDFDVANVGQELHCPGIGGETAVDQQRFNFWRAIGAQCIKQIGCLIRHRFEARAHEMLKPRVAREADDRAARFGIPLRRAQARERRYEIDAAIVSET